MCAPAADARTNAGAHAAVQLIENRHARVDNIIGSARGSLLRPASPACKGRYSRLCGIALL